MRFIRVAQAADRQVLIRRLVRRCLRLLLPLPALLAAAIISCVLPTRADDSLLGVVADVPLPGGTLRFDYQSLDRDSGRLFISHMRDNAVVVFDIKQNKVLANLPEFPGVTGVLFVSQLKRVYASLSGTGEIAVLDAVSLKRIALIPGGSFPDGIAYYPSREKLYVSDEKGGAEIVIDAATNRRLLSIPLGGGVGNTIYDPSTELLYVTVGSSNELISIDPAVDQVTGRYPLAGGSKPHGLYVDSENNRAFIACEGNNRLLVFDLKQRSVTKTFPLGSGPDVLAFDSGLKRLYVASESGTVSIFAETEAQLAKLGDVFVEKSAHTISVDSETHKIYLPLKNLHGGPVLRIMQPKLDGSE